MTIILCSKPCSFFSEDKEIKILDEDRQPFYFHTNTAREITFNLPVGKYFTRNKITLLDTFKPYNNYKTPNFDLTGYKIIIGNNPHKATITPAKRQILVDSSINKIKYKPAKKFLIGHEIFHLHCGGNKYALYDAQGKGIGTPIYDAERECDDCSEKNMLNIGYNPTQIKLAKNLILDSFERKICNYENNFESYRR